MRIGERKEGNDIIVIMDGSLDENSSSQAEAALNRVLDEDTEKVFLDLSSVRYISSIGLRALIVAHKKAVKSAKELKIIKISEKAEEILKMVGILQLFQGN